MDLAGTGLNEIMAEFESHWLGGEVEGAQYLPAEAAFFRDIVGGVVREQSTLDPLIDAALDRGWPLKRIEAVLRAVLRAGAYELACRATCRRAWWCRNMSTSPAPSSTTRRPAWSMPCSISWRTRCARPNSTAPSVERRLPSCGRVASRDAKLSESAEDRLIARYFRPLATHPGALGLADDAAVLTPPPGCDLVLTTDGVIAGVHFFPDDPAGHIGRKALRVNLSDLAAKGATPVGFLLSLALPTAIDEAWLAAFAGGLGEDAERYGCPLLGGDTDRTPGPLSISIAAFGTVPHGKMVRRSTAQAGDRDRGDRHDRRCRARPAAAPRRKPRQALATDRTR